MSSRTFIALASAVLASVHGASADILSCADVDCPVTEGTTSATCTVGDKTFNSIGLTSLDTDVDRLRGLSWVKAVGARNVSTEERAFDQSFYLGTPDDFDFEDTGACAVFFTEVSESVRFGDEDPRTSQGTCGQALSDSCVSALTDRARRVDFNGLRGRRACERLQQEFNDNLDSACSNAASGSNWSGIRAVALTGDGAPDEIEDGRNRSTNCWPVLPKSDDLTLVDSVSTTGNYDASTLTDNFFGITPILTVWYPSNDDDNDDGDDTDSDNLVTETVAQLTCLKAMDLTTASNDTQSPGGGNGGNGDDDDNDDDDDDDDDDRNAAGRMVGSGSLAIWGGLLSVAMVLLA
ncbi:uncharacterized protein B0H64DRAFT_45997 [Chaetomium fimeti]|uniref:Uncharacterized protein n=1 Tax=Chaetomium fimeti TaxID=1854472 RepID=A0AAE0H7F2_9PEZI|nr:hypothetical protein B0H64DRAFT_45997 [Chaetomium fimeti]